MEDSTPNISRSQETLKPPPKFSSDKMETKLERSQLKERIKAEKVKAVNLKRLGKQAEALDPCGEPNSEKKFECLSIELRTSCVPF